MEQSSAAIIATLGPATDNKKSIEQLIDAGVNVFRLNMAHGTIETQKETFDRVRTVSQKKNVPIGILCDLPGYKIRLKSSNYDELTLGQHVNVGFEKGDLTFNHDIISYLDVGQKVLLNNGTVEIKVTKKSSGSVEAECIKPGKLPLGKGVNVPGVDFNWPHLSPRDEKVLKSLVNWDPDFIGISFVRSKEQVEVVKKFWEKKKHKPWFIAKIEHAKAVDNLMTILQESDGAMVARGDLGLEVPIQEVALWQKRIIKHVNQVNKISIVATSMLESMIHSNIPTRAEVSDVTNAVIDDTDAVMLSDETAVGEYPIDAATLMRCIVEEVENSPEFKNLPENPYCKNFYTVLAEAAKACLNSYNFQALVVFTESGKSAITLSKVRSQAPIFAFTDNPHTYTRLSLSWKVHPILVDKFKGASHMIEQAVDVLKERKLVKLGAHVLSVSGKSFTVGSTDTLKVIHVK